MSRIRNNWQLGPENPHNKENDVLKTNAHKIKNEAYDNPGKDVMLPNKRQALGVINKNYTTSYKDPIISAYGGNPFSVNSNGPLGNEKGKTETVFTTNDNYYQHQQYTNLFMYASQNHAEKLSPLKFLKKNLSTQENDVSKIISNTNSFCSIPYNTSCNTLFNSHLSLSTDVPSNYTSIKESKPCLYDLPIPQEDYLTDLNYVRHNVCEQEKTLNTSLNAVSSPMVVVVEDKTLPLPENDQNDVYYNVSEYAQDILTYLKESEINHKPRSAYMTKQPDITFTMRATVVDWLVEVASEYKLINKTLHLACSYIDRFLSIMAISRSKLQLLGTTCMFIASKFEEIYPPDINEFVYITDGTYTKEQVIRMEQLILKILSFRMGPPTILCFLEKFSKLNNLPKITQDLAEYLAELTLLDGETYLKYVPSIIACSAICMSNLTMLRDPWDVSLQKHSGYSYTDFVPCLKDLYQTMSNASHNQHQKAIYEKYLNTKYNEVAKIPPSPPYNLFIKDI